jgi:hypothetical protein
MTLHQSTFDYLKPTDKQLQIMGHVRAQFANLAALLGDMLPEGPDKTYVLRHLRECAMWSMVAITRHPDGAPREEVN